MTTQEKIADYLSCFEAGEVFSINLFTEAYPMSEVKAALFDMAYNDKIRLIACGHTLQEWADEQGCTCEEAVEGDREFFIGVKIL